MSENEIEAPPTSAKGPGAITTERGARRDGTQSVRPWRVRVPSTYRTWGPGASRPAPPARAQYAGGWLAQPVRTLRRRRGVRGSLGRDPGPIPPRRDPGPISPPYLLHISSMSPPHLPCISPISAKDGTLAPYLPCISLYLPISPCICLHLPGGQVRRRRRGGPRHAAPEHGLRAGTRGVQGGRSRQG